MTCKLPSIVSRGILLGIVLCLVGAGYFDRVNGQGGTPCVDCIKNASQLPGHGARSASDSRRVINVRIAPSWGQQTDANIWNATLGSSGPGALSSWNSVGSPYYFDLRQDVSDSDTDFLIVRDSNWDYDKQGCAVTSTPAVGSGRTQRVVHLPPTANGWSQGDLACVLAHEIGHGVGLTGALPSCQSIMAEKFVQKEADCTCTRQVSQQDADRANQFASTPQNCKKEGKVVANFGGGGPGFEDPNPYRYYPICYYYYEAVDIYYCRMMMSDGTCHPEFPPVYIDTIYVLRDVRCY